MQMPVCLYFHGGAFIMDSPGAVFTRSSDYPTLAEATLRPLLIVIGDRDMLREQARAYYESFVKHDKAAQTIVFEENQGFHALKQDTESIEALIHHIVSFKLS